MKRSKRDNKGKPCVRHAVKYQADIGTKKERDERISVTETAMNDGTNAVDSAMV